MKKTDCPRCMAMLAPRNGQPRDIPETMERTMAVWATQDCIGAHDLVSWLLNPSGAAALREPVDNTGEAK